MRLIIAAVLSALALPAAAQAPTADPGLQEPLSVWKRLEGGALEHRQSGFVCPADMDERPRLGAALYEPHGLDVSCGYRVGAGTVTFYLTRRERPDLKAEMTEAKRQLEAVWVQRGAVKLEYERNETGDGLSWAVARYGLTQGLTSDIRIAVVDAWALKFRATFPAADEAKIQAATAALLAEFRRTAGVHLAACAKSPPPERKGRRITDAKTLQSAAMQGSLLGGVMRLSQGEAPAAAAPALIWCPEAPFDTDRAPLLHWRAVRADGSVAEVDRVTAMSTGEPVVLAAAPQGISAAGASPKRWAATLEDKGQVLILGYFDGRPRPSDLADLLNDALTGKAKPLIGYSASGKTLNVTMPPGK